MTNGPMRSRQRPTWGRSLVGQAAACIAVCIAATILAIELGGYFWARWVWFATAVTLGLRFALRRTAAAPPHARVFALHAWATLVLVPMEVVIWAFSGGGLFWPIWPIIALTVALAVHAAIRYTRADSREQQLTERVDILTRTRRGVVDVQAAELKRIERDLHDGAQARIVSLAINLGLAEDLAKRDPASVVEMIGEARQSALTALDELRTVMSGIQPPVLSDRGLVGAIEALAIDLSVPTTVIAAVPGPLPTPVESAVYLAVGECLANVVKHSHARNAWVRLSHTHDMLRVVTGDDGIGGASLEAGTGLRGIVSRLAVFDGTLEVHSPAGGPTEVFMEVPCELSSPKTSSSSATD